MKVVYILVSICIGLLLSLQGKAQSFNWIKSCDGKYWEAQKSIQATGNTFNNPDVTLDKAKTLMTFEAWGTCFNELGWDALNELKKDQQLTVMKQLFSTSGDLRFSLGRIPMNSNDYARDWYSCDEVTGDFQLDYFNIDRDKSTLIPFIKAAQQQNPSIDFWLSPWSPPSWMKVNHYYSVRSDKKYNKMPSESDVILYEGSADKNNKVFPKQIAINDYFIQDPRYLKAYANYFCKFIDAYKDKGILINTVMYQNEAYSYTIYPGCAWTPEGTIRFNVEYLAPTLKEKHPEVSLYLGTINTNRYELVDKILSDSRMSQSIQGIGFQWEGGQILPQIREKYPNYKYVQTESECGWGSFDWKAAEHTFERINYYLSNGCTKYTFWNAILADDGNSGWGWKQNALIRVNSQTKTPTYTPEYYAVKHYCHFISSGARLVASKQSGQDDKPILIFLTPNGKLIVIAGNFKDKQQNLNVKIGGKYLDLTLAAHSLNSFEEN